MGKGSWEAGTLSEIVFLGPDVRGNLGDVAPIEGHTEWFTLDLIYFLLRSQLSIGPNGSLFKVWPIIRSLSPFLRTGEEAGYLVEWKLCRVLEILPGNYKDKESWHC